MKTYLSNLWTAIKLVGAAIAGKPVQTAGGGGKAEE